MDRTTLSVLVLIAVVAAAGGAGCAAQTEPRDPETRTWVRNMWTGPAVLPYEAAARPLPERTMAIDGHRLLNRREARLALTNPLEPTPEVLAEGAALYDTYCALCHGGAGAGDGQLADRYRRMPDLTLPHVLNYPDGFVYSIIREGGRNMPRFADALNIDERWALVHHLRTLDPDGASARAASPPSTR